MTDLLPVVVLCAAALGTALAVVLLRRPVHAAITLLAHSLALAGLYVTLAADFVAVAQVLIYAGAIVVLFLFVVALLPTGGREEAPGWGRAVAALGVGGVMLAALVAVMPSALLAAPAQAASSVHEVGRALFGPLLIPFELTAPLLLAAIVGAVTLWRRQEAP